MPILSGVSPDAERWVELSAYDLTTAEAMLTSGRYLYVLFCSQQAVEKRLKAIIVERTEAFPPRTHDLVKLAQAAGVQLPEQRDVLLRTLNKYYIGTRYPEEISILGHDETKAIASQALSDTKEFLKWLGELKK